MPIYEYACASCGVQEERLERLDAPESHECPVCREPGAMRRRLSRTAFVLSGGGWYASGYGGEAPAGSAATAAAGTSEPAARACGGGCACHTPVGEGSAASNS